MAAVYPGALPTIAANKSDDTDSKSGADLGVSTTTGDHAAHHNKLAEELVAIATELGVNPSASFADVTTRLNAVTSVRKTADQTNTTTTLANMTDMSFPVVIGGTYRFDFLFSYSSSLVTAGIGVAVTTPAVAAGGLNYQGAIGGFAAAGAGATWHGEAQASDGLIMSTAVAVINTFYICRVHGVLHNPTAAGSIQLRFRAEVAATITVKAGAHGILYTG
jgi:hypothetical protein